MKQKELENLISESINKNISKPRYVVAIDFDGTVVTHEYPDVGEDIGAVPVLKKIVESGGALVLNTMRSHRKLEDGRDTLQDGIDWFEENGIPLYGVNSNPTQKGWTDSPKVYGHLYIDDGMANCPLVHPGYGMRPYVDWNKMEKWLEKQGYIEPDFYREIDNKELLRDLFKSISDWTEEAVLSEDEGIQNILNKLEDIRSIIIAQYNKE